MERRDKTKVKVQITKGVHRFSYDGKQYLPGDTLEIAPAYFRSDFMVEVAEPIMEVAVEEVPKDEGSEEKSESKPASKKRRS